MPQTDISGPLDVLNFLLAWIGCPGRHRAFIDAVVGMADNRTEWFDAPDWETGRRIRGTAVQDAEMLPVTTVKKTAQRERDAFNEWQAAEGWTLVECMPGGRGSRTGAKYKTRYRVPLLAVAEAVYERARRAPLWATNRGKAVRKAAAPYLPELRDDGRRPPRREREGIGRANTDTPSRWLKAARTNALRAFDLAERSQGIEQARDRIRTFALDLLAVVEGDAPLTVDGSVHSPEAAPEAQTVDTSVHSAAGGSEAPTVDRSVHSRFLFSSGQPDDGPPVEWIAPEPVPPPTPGPNETTHHESSQGGPDRTVRDHTPPGPNEHGPGRMAARALAALMLAGVGRVEVRLIRDTDDGGRCVWAETFPSVEAFAEAEPALRERAWAEGLSLVVRPLECPGFPNLDDLTPDQAARLGALAFDRRETSPGSWQAHVLVAGVTTEEEGRAVRAGILRALGGPANAGGGGAYRWPGSPNAKPAHRRADGSRPVVAQYDPATGRAATLAELREARLYADLPAPDGGGGYAPFPSVRVARVSRVAGLWPVCG